MDASISPGATGLPLEAIPASAPFPSIRKPLQRWKIVCYLLAIFLCGAFVGSVLTVGYIQRRNRQWLDPEKVTTEFVDDLKHRLSLTADQREAITPIVRDSAEHIRDIRLKAMRDIFQTMQDRRLALDEKLTPDQGKIFDDLAARRQQRTRHWLGLDAAPSPGK